MDYHVYKIGKIPILFLVDQKQAFAISDEEYNDFLHKKDCQIILRKYRGNLGTSKNDDSKIEKDYKYELYLCVANCCNAMCTYCFANQGDYGKEKGIMPVEMAYKAVDFFMEIVPCDCTAIITFFGGEPLMAYPIITACCKYVEKKYHERKYEFHITTNATLLTIDIIDFLAEYKFKIAISIDGGAVIQNRQRPLLSGKDSFVEATKHLHYMLDKKMHILARGTYTDYSVSLVQCYDDLLKLGFGEVNIELDLLDKKRGDDMLLLLDQLETLYHYMIDYIKMKDDFPFGLFTMQMRRLFIPLKRNLNGCGAGKVTFAVDIKGDIFPCHRHSSISQAVMGNVRNYQLPFNFLDVDYNNSKCASCWNRYTCSHGCMYDDRMLSDSYFIKNPYFCLYAQKMTELAIGLCREIGKDRLIRILTGK